MLVHRDALKPVNLNSYTDGVASLDHSPRIAASSISQFTQRSTCPSRFLPDDPSQVPTYHIAQVVA